MMKKIKPAAYSAYVAEFLGTFTLSLVVSLSLLGTLPIPTPVAAALTLGLLVYSLGSFSGTQINPAITIGLWSIKKISDQDAVLYLLVQFLGAAVALAIAGFLGVHALDLPIFSLKIAIAEALGTFFFSLGIASVVTGQVAKNLNGLVVGGSLLLGVMIAGSAGSAGILNPAVALSIHMLSPFYLLGPIVGAVLGFNAYQQLLKLRLR